MKIRTNKIAYFYDRDDEKLMFYLKTNSIADVVAQSFEFDDLATERHIKDYPRAYKEYLEKKAIAGDVVEQMQKSPV